MEQEPIKKTAPWGRRVTRTSLLRLTLADDKLGLLPFRLFNLENNLAEIYIQGVMGGSAKSKVALGGE